MPKRRRRLLRTAAFVIVLAAILGLLVFLPKRSGPPDWSFDADEAKRRQEEAARRLGIPVEKDIYVGEGVRMKLILIPAGDFMMGAPMTERGHRMEDRPLHRVRITKAFYMGVTEVTQEQYEDVMGKSRFYFRGVRRPADRVSWNDAVLFCRRLSTRAAARVRLPTEAEWEYSCRAGSSAAYCFGDDYDTLDDYAWCDGSNSRTTHDVGAKMPNAWGLYDMHGNVWEWCQDWYDGLYYKDGPMDDPQGSSRGEVPIMRGGAWMVGVTACRCAARWWYGSPDFASSAWGFRVVVEVAR